LTERPMIKIRRVKKGKNTSPDNRKEMASNKSSHIGTPSKVQESGGRKGGTMREGDFKGLSREKSQKTEIRRRDFKDYTAINKAGRDTRTNPGQPRKPHGQLNNSREGITAEQNPSSQFRPSCALGKDSLKRKRRTSASALNHAELVKD